MKKVLKYGLIILVGIIAVIVIYINAAWDKDFDAPYPDLKASIDSSIIARGRYLAYGPAHCAYCHVPVNRISEVAEGKIVPLIGGGKFDIPPALIHSPNITPDDETGIGNLSDKQLARSLRYMVNHKNKFMVPFMAFEGLSDEDLTAIISFLRSQKPVKHEVEPNEYRFLGKALLAFGMLKPEGPKTQPPVSMKKDTTAEYGSYLANNVANCVGCHTNRDLKTGEFIGKPFAGGFEMEAESYATTQKGYLFITPNLTPDKLTGYITEWSEEDFVNRFRGGRLHDGSPMPWEAYATIDDTELKAIYKYLMSLKPVAHKIDKIVIEPVEKN